MGLGPRSDVGFRRLFDEHHRAIQAYCARRLSPEDANDATAEVFLVTWRKLDTIPPGDEARLWLYGIAKNVVRNQQRSVRRSGRLHGKLAGLRVDTAPDPATQIVQRADHARILDALENLPETDREVLRLRNWEELSAVEISSVTGLSVRAVETRLSRARKRLARSLSDVPLARPQPVEEGGEL
ncbi:MAG: RNA polymerase sigma factor [Acidimicrobiia bacterium]